MELHLEINQNAREIKARAAQCNFTTPLGNTLLITPPLNEDFWIFRVAVSDKQAIVGFPKFMTIGIGFQVEEADWNTNLPFTSDAEELYEHIKENKGDGPTKEDCLAAIRMVQEAAAQLTGKRL